MRASSSVCLSVDILAFHYRSITKLSIALAIALIAASPDARTQTVGPPQVTYTITDLGTLPQGDPRASTYGYAINASGDVAGMAVAHDEQLHAVIFKDDTVIDLGILPNASLGVGSGINGYDDVTGYLQFPAPDFPAGSFTHAFLYSSGKMRDIGTLPGDSISVGAAINDSGQVTGSSTTPITPGEASFPVAHGFLYSAGTMTNVASSYGADVPANGQSINSAGEVAGWATLPDGPVQHAAVFSKGSITLLNLPIPPSSPSKAYGINDFGQLTGLLYRADDNADAFLYSSNGGVDIGRLPGDQDSQGNGINASGQVVGDSLGLSSGLNFPFSYTPAQGLINLNSLLPAGSGWVLTDAEAINDKGQITGWGTNPDGLQRAYLLSPVFVPFLKMDALVDMNSTQKDSFAVDGTFTLGKNNSGIDPLTEIFVLQLDGYHITLPPASFVGSRGAYFYKGKIGEVTVEAAILQMTSKDYLFGITGRGATGLPKGCAPNLVLTIGSTTGTEETKTNHGSDRDHLCRYR